MRSLQKLNYREKCKLFYFRKHIDQLAVDISCIVLVQFVTRYHGNRVTIALYLFVFS